MFQRGQRTTYFRFHPSRIRGRLGFYSFGIAGRVLVGITGRVWASGQLLVALQVTDVVPTVVRLEFPTAAAQLPGRCQRNFAEKLCVV